MRAATSASVRYAKGVRYAKSPDRPGDGHRPLPPAAPTGE